MLSWEELGVRREEYVSFVNFVVNFSPQRHKGHKGTQRNVILRRGTLLVEVLFARAV
jgi:hypothetical protein